MAAAFASFEQAKRAGDEATKAGDYEAAEGAYSAALAFPSGASTAAVLCNRALARLNRGQWQLVEEDTTAALAQQPEEKLRVKALFRRGLAREALGELEASDSDLNLALKAAPTNEGIVAAAKRVHGALGPKPEVQAWVSPQPYTTAAVLKLAGGPHGYLGMSEHPCVRFACGVAVQAYDRSGGLFAIRQAVGPPQPPPTGVTVATSKLDYQDVPNYELKDGVNAEYDRGGNLQTVYQQLSGELNGPWVAFNSDGSVNWRETSAYSNGRVVSKLKSDVPEGFLAYVFRELVVPVKKALGIGLAPGEEELCNQHHVKTDTLPPAVLAVPESGLEKRKAYHYGATWEELLSAPPQCEVGPEWVGPFGTEARAPAAPVTTSSRRPAEELAPELARLQGAWVDEAADTPVGRIEGGCVVWHRSFRSRPCRLGLTEGGVSMELEGKTYKAIIEHGPRLRLVWSDGDRWIRVK